MFVTVAFFEAPGVAVDYGLIDVDSQSRASGYPNHLIRYRFPVQLATLVILLIYCLDLKMYLDINSFYKYRNTSAKGGTNGYAHLNPFFTRYNTISVLVLSSPFCFCC